jgi:hypothetical protein
VVFARDRQLTSAREDGGADKALSAGDTEEEESAADQDHTSGSGDTKNEESEADHRPSSYAEEEGAAYQVHHTSDTEDGECT